MSFEYKKNKGHDNESFWTSYSDLFLGLSSIFLMLYVVASLRTGTDSIKFKSDNQKLQVEVQDLKNQLQSYEAVKDNYIKKQATKNELGEYNELMDKLVLLQEDAKNEKNNLRKSALENEQKEHALNKYQQMVRNVINANNLAKVKIINRNEIITDQDQTIDVKNEKITSLSTDISKMTNLVQVKENEIQNVNMRLSHRMADLKKSLNQSKLTHKAYQTRLKKLQDDADKSLASIRSEKEQVAQNLSTMQRQLASTQTQLDSTEGELGKTKGALEARGHEVAGLKGQLGSLESETQAKIKGLQGGYAREQSLARGQFEAALANQKNLSGAEIARKEAEFKAAGDAKDRKLAGEISGLTGKLRDTQGRLAAAEAELTARKGIADEIKKGFKGVGVKADIDMESGDVVLDFGNAYFDNNSADLKEDMRKVLQKAMPIYSKSLFGNAKVSNKISAVEVIGFASPTYQGRVVDPYSNKPQDLAAIKYNMDLSYKRAKSIFNYLLDGKDMNFTYHQNLVPALKVSGRSFLDLMKSDRTIASAEDYCKKNDCKKSQRVIIRFNMDNKK
ncbi:MAG: microtubule-binding protein [Moraxellaceae bacterium]|nr:microtubule-binding protein [Pseudobdellovibrionaceae bacterium]